MTESRMMTLKDSSRASNYLKNIRRQGLMTDVRNVVASIEKHFRETGWISPRQLDVLRRCSLATNRPHRMGGFTMRVSYGR